MVCLRNICINTLHKGDNEDDDDDDEDNNNNNNNKTIIIIIIIIIIICKEAIKSKVFPIHAMKVYMGRRGTAPLILNLWGDVNFTSHSLSH